MDTARPVSFGALVLPNEPWSDLVARWQRLEAGGIDAVWSCDHFANPHGAEGPWWEGSVSLAGLATATSRVRIGLLVGAIASRPPTLLAKQAQTIDHASGGRLTVGMGAGGAPTDQRMWGLPTWTPAERVERFAEYVELVERLLRASDVDHAGRWYATDGARMGPPCVQSPRPPLLLAAHGPASLRVAARHADVWNTYGPGLDDAIANGRRLDEACRDLGRDPTEITRSVLFGIRDDTAWTTATELADLVRRWHDAGFRDFVFYDPPYAGSGLRTAPPGTVTELLEETIPRLRSELDPPQ
jgi:alkanesulfonate monooxygenase SsuD/methylene tetrahydromethanopterin reductase-like flavin-dependent oxidoreductase (luciferase family)